MLQVAKRSIVTIVVIGVYSVVIVSIAVVLRHTFATNLVTRGVPLYHVQALLGHSTPLMTQRYAHVAPDTLRDAIRVLDVPPVTPNYPNFGQPVGRRAVELADLFQKEAA